MDRLEEIYKIQKEFTEKLFKDKFNIDELAWITNNANERAKWSKEYIISIHKKASEILEQMNWKMHIDKNNYDIKDNYLEIGIDILKYLLGLFSIYGFTYNDVYEKFIDKSNVVENKIKTQASIKNIKNENYKKIAFVDIDGVLANWAKAYISFVNDYFGINCETLYDIENSVVDNKKYFVKTEFRVSGIKRKLELINDAKLFLDKLKENNYYIVLITARPYKQVFRLYNDTLMWLKNNSLSFDTIIFDEQKEKYIIENFPKIKPYSFIIDDNIDNCNKVAKNGFIAYFKYNELMYKKEETFDVVKQRLYSSVIPIKELSELIDKLNLK